jgi:DNA ligase-1
MNVDEWDGTGTLPPLYAKTATGAINVWVCWVSGAHVVVQWGQDGGAQQQARFECKPKNAGRANATTAEEQAIKEAVAKWKKQVKKKYFETPEAAGTELNLKPMLAKSFEDRKAKVTYPVDVQPKLDGVRCFAYRRDGRVFLQSRGGDPYDVEHIRSALEPCLTAEGHVLDGELYLHGTSLQNITSLVKRPQEGSERLSYCIYDHTFIETYNTAWQMRRTVLERWFKESAPSESILPVPTVQAESEERVRALHDHYVKAGYEGAIIRTLDGVYKFGYRSSDLLKLKSFQDAEFPIVGWTVGKGKFANVPIFKCTTGEGKEFDVAPKGTDAERLEMLRKADSLIGKQLTVRFFDWTDERIPHFPVGICIREEGT